MARPKSNNVIVIGSGIGGLSAAVELAAAGMGVTVLEQAYAPGGKLRQLPTEAGPIDVGPAVLTMRSVFDELFARAGTRLDEHVSLTAETHLARHWWQDGSSLDLFADPEESARAVADFAGDGARQEFIAFSAKARRLFEAFDEPVMQNPVPGLAALSKTVLGDIRTLLPALAPTQTMAQCLDKSFSDPRLRQLFGRYATHAGGSPFSSPAFLSLIWDVKSRDVWRVEGGVITLAKALEKVASERGAEFRYGTEVETILVERNRVVGVMLDTGERIDSEQVLFNGDPAALTRGILGRGTRRAVKRTNALPRSLSAYIWAFAAKPSGVDLLHHNVFFGQDQRSEFDALARGDIPEDPTLCVCAPDRADGTVPAEAERFEIVMNGAPVDDAAPANPGEFSQCRALTFDTLKDMNLSFDVSPQRTSLITPRDLALRFPGSNGSMFGRSPDGLRGTFQCATTRSRIPGLYLAGGGVHLGTGMPMASLSGRHAAEAILTDNAAAPRAPKSSAKSAAATMIPSGPPQSSNS